MISKNLSRRGFNRIILSAAAGSLLPDLVFSGYANQQKINIVQIGTRHSHAEEKYQTALKLKKFFDVKGIIENDPFYLNKAQEMAEFDKAVWLSEEQLSDDSEIKALLIETDFNELLPAALKYAAKGYHLHVDKPPGDSLEGLIKLYEIAAKKDLVIQMGYMLRYNPAFQFCLDAVKKGMLGPVYQVDGVISKKISSKRRAHLASSYGGAMMLLGCHLVDILVALCGKPHSVQSFRRQTYRQQDTLYDNELAVFSYPQMTATIRSSLMEVGGMDRRQFIVAGETGTIEIRPLEPPALTIVLDKPFEQYAAGKHHIELPEMSGRYDEQLKDFASQIKGTKKTVYDANHDLAVHETLLKACELH